MTMSSFLFGKKNPQNDVDYKSRVEYKLYLAREDPEPVFDLSECNLKSVPSGIFSLCKVFRKEKLLLQVNQLPGLSSGGSLSDLCFLSVLNLHTNRLSTLPEDIGHLTNLQELNVSHNELRKLPDSIGSLGKLQVLDCSHNKLRRLPCSLGQMIALTRLDLRHNPPLSCLPPALSLVNNLQHLLVDENSLHSPPPAVAQQGTAAIMQYLSKHNNKQYIPVKPDKSDDPKTIKDRKVDNSSCLQDPYTLLEKKKEEKMQELIKMERNLQEQKIKEYHIHENMKQNKSKLLMNLRVQQQKVEKDVTRFQNQKEQERARLLAHLLEVEAQAEETIGDLLALNQALQRSSQWQEQDLKEQQQLNDYKIKSNQLRRREIIDAMESLLAEECARKKKLLDYQKMRAEVVQSSLKREMEWGQQVCFLLSTRDTHQAALLSAVEADTEVQKALVATLLEKSDLRSQSLVIQVTMVEKQLAVLTAVELQRRNMDSHQQLNNLAEKRKILSDLLVVLLREQEDRRTHLLDTLHQMDIINKQECESSPDFWLRQYQRLLDVKPPQLRALEPELIHELVKGGVAHCLPILAYCHVQSLTPSQLAQIGVISVKDQEAILQAVNTYLTHTQAQYVPSAPPLEEPSAPPAPARDILPECIVCMETECTVVFVPCGHICTCVVCASQLQLCPLCRAPLERTVMIYI